MLSPTARTLKWLRDMGYTAEVVERWNSHARKRFDLFGWGDIVAIGLPLTEESKRLFWGAMDRDHPIIIQCTSGANHSARVKKAKPLAQPWLMAGGLGYVVSWALKGKRGERKKWTVRVEEL